MHSCPLKPSDEAKLIARCLEGDESAWAILFGRYHQPLLLIVRSLIKNDSLAEPAEEITARVWCSLCGDTYSRLRRYDPRFGRLLDYLVGMARNEMLRGRRAERNRISREYRVARDEATFDQADWGLMVQEFLRTLTPREREFCLADLMKEGAGIGLKKVSVANGWQLRCRVLKKFRKYYARELR